MKRPLRIGLAANRLHIQGADSALPRLLNEARESIVTYLRPQFVVVGRTLDAIQRLKILEGYPHLERFPYGREGGLMRLVSRIVDHDPEQGLDAIIYLMDPVDPSSIFPEAVALKRQCIIHGKPFLSSFAGAREWLELEAVAAGAAFDPRLNDVFDLSRESIALIAHDSMKQNMLALAEKHFTLLDRFSTRYATGTTGGLLNELAMRIKGPAAGKNWVSPLLSGPMGGDAQIAELILDKKCRRTLFLEDPHVARQHEADIQLLERAARTVSDFASCVTELKFAERWCTLMQLRTRSP